MLSAGKENHEQRRALRRLPAGGPAVNDDLPAVHWLVRIDLVDDGDPVLAAVWETEPTAVEERGAFLVAGYPSEEAARLAATLFGSRAAVTSVDDDTWADAWRAHAEPVVAGAITVVPTWCDIPDDPGTMIRLDPGRAFGSGSHPSTRLMLGLLPSLVTPGSRVLDVGTGSGVLAVTAAVLGAGQVIGIDIDTASAPVARSNAELNGVADRCTFSTDTVDRMNEPFDVVLANILPGTLLRLAEDLVARLEPGGRLALSGIPSGDAERVAVAFGGRQLARVDEDDWAALVLG